MFGFSRVETYCSSSFSLTPYPFSLPLPAIDGDLQLLETSGTHKEIGLALGIFLFLLSSHFSRLSEILGNVIDSEFAGFKLVLGVHYK